MDTCSTKLEIHNKMGSTQDQRVLPALLPDYFLVDERSEVDLIHATQKLAKYIKFIDKNDAENEDWRSFFDWESTGILVKIFKSDVESIQATFERFKQNKTNGQKQKLINFFTILKSECTKQVENINRMDQNIEAKEYFTSTAGLVPKLLDGILDQLNNEPNILLLIQKNTFNSLVQQFFGLLYTWKTISGETLNNQLQNYDAHSPHFALFLSFLKLYGVAQNQLNEFTTRHLDFYYKDILQLKSLKATPDYAHLLIEPVANKSVLLPKESVFKAGKDSRGVNKYYASTSDQVINSIKLKSFVSSFTDESSTWNQADFKELNGTNKSINVFNTEKETADIGLLIASPLLYLRGGTRKITLTFNGTLIDVVQYDFYVTAEDKWLHLQKFDEKTIEIPAKEKAIVPFDAEKHDGIAIHTSFPVLKIIPKPTAPAITVDSIQITIDVAGLKDFIVTTDTGLADLTKPFFPFGQFPNNGSSFMIGCSEFFGKYNAKLANDFSELKNCSIHIMNDGLWMKELEIDEKEPNVDGYVKPEFINTTSVENYFQKDEAPNKNSKTGYFKVQYNDSGIPFLERYIKASVSEENDVLPTPPSLNLEFLSYTVTDSYSFSGEKANNNPIEFFHLLPFGYESTSSSQPLVFPKNPPVNGEIFLGFENAVPQNNLSFLIQVEDGTANPRRRPATISWSFLHHNSWIDFNSNEISDETFGLTVSGIVNCKIPEFDTSTTTVLESSLFWIKITVDGKDAICNFFGVHHQAIKVVLFDFEQRGSTFLENTPKETISKLVEPNFDVKKIEQPYASFLGRVQQNEADFYVDASERLRHKNRAITSWDYEKLILKEFPEVYRVKCLNHYRLGETISNAAAGYVTLIPIAKSRNNSNPVAWKPLASLGTMKRIKEYLSKIASPHARILVKSPCLEKIEVSFKVKYREILGADSRLFSEKLITAINAYLSPWAYENTEVKFNKTIEISELIQLIDNQSFVDFVSDFNVNQFIIDPETDAVVLTVFNVKEIVPQTDFTLFIPNENHQVNEITSHCCS
jgi:hypothetical protein